MTAFDGLANFGDTTVATAPSPAASGTTLVVSADFSDAAVPFNIVIAPPNQKPTAANAEIARVTAKGGGGNTSWTIVRAQEGTSARTIVAGDAVSLYITKKTVTDLQDAAIKSGMIIDFAGKVAPAGYLLCDGSAVSRATYADLFAAVISSLGTFTVTIASPGVFTLNAHGLLTGEEVYLTTTGALPTGLAQNTIYYAIFVSANTFNLATTRANAIAGTKINTSGTQSGVHTIRSAPWGIGDGSTTFNVPDLRSRVAVGAVGGSGGHSDITVGNDDGVALANRNSKHNSTNSLTLPDHVHSLTALGSNTNTTTGGGGDRVTSGGALGLNTDNPTTHPAIAGTIGPGGTLPVDTPAFGVVTKIIKT
jgi:microcystin-dependent protein